MKQTELTVEEAFHKACELQVNGKLDQALEIYDNLLSIMPGAAILQAGRGLIFFQQKQYDHSVKAYDMALDLEPENADVWFNRAIALKKSGNFTEAISSYKKALELSPDDPDFLYNTACCHQAMEQDKKAINFYDKTLHIHPEHCSALNNLAYLLHKQGETIKAKKLYSRLVNLQPDHEGANYMLAALSGNTPENAPQSYIRDLFNSYSDTYEQSLVNNLEYSVPDVLYDLCNQTPGRKNLYDKGIDLGCGTGLSGAAFKDMCRTLMGVDLSAQMIQKAEEKGIYQELKVMDIVDFLKPYNNTFDLLVAADVFNYIGDLKPVITAAHKAATPEALFCFSTEQTDNKNDYQLQKTGRFTHSEKYLRLILQQSNWLILEQQSAALRKEKGSWVQGKIYICRPAG